MARGTFEFDLDNPEDNMAFYRAAKSLDVCLVLWEILYNTKKKFQYDVEALPEQVTKMNMYDIIDLMYERFWEITNERGVNLDELVN